MSLKKSLFATAAAILVSFSAVHFAWSQEATTTDYVARKIPLSQIAIKVSDADRLIADRYRKLNPDNVEELSKRLDDFHQRLATAGMPSGQEDNIPLSFVLDFLPSGKGGLEGQSDQDPWDYQGDGHHGQRVTPGRHNLDGVPEGDWIDGSDDGKPDFGGYPGRSIGKTENVTGVGTIHHGGGDGEREGKGNPLQGKSLKSLGGGKGDGGHDDREGQAVNLNSLRKLGGGGIGGVDGGTGTLEGDKGAQALQEARKHGAGGTTVQDGNFTDAASKNGIANPRLKAADDPNEGNEGKQPTTPPTSGGDGDGGDSGDSGPMTPIQITTSDGEGTTLQYVYGGLLNGTTIIFKDGDKSHKGGWTLVPPKGDGGPASGQ